MKEDSLTLSNNGKGEGGKLLSQLITLWQGFACYISPVEALVTKKYRCLFYDSEI